MSIGEGSPPGTSGLHMGGEYREDGGRRGNGLERNHVSRYSFGTSSHSRFIAHSFGRTSFTLDPV